MHISVVIPAYNCALCIGQLYKRLVITIESITNDFEIIFINDASPDNDWNLIKSIADKDKRVIGIDFSRNFGQHSAITAGLDYSSGDWIVVMDCDLQDQPEEIKKLYQKAKEGYDIVVGKRVDRKDTFFKRLLSKIFYRILEYLSGIKHDSSIANFGIYSRRVINNIIRLREENRNFPLFVKWVGFDSAEIEIDHGERYAGKSSYSFSKKINLGIDSIVAYSILPLKISIKIGFIMTLFSVLFSLWLVIKYFLYGIPVEGWKSLMVSMIFMFGILFANIGFLGLYIGKIFNETKNRPLYLIKNFVNIDLSPKNKITCN